MPRAVLKMFEDQLQLFFGNRCEAIGVNSGTSALIATLWSLGLKPGDEVITTPFTFTATVNAIVIAGGTPVFADIQESDFLIDPSRVQALVTDRTRAVLPVHLFGNVCNMEAINHVAKRNGLVVIEDSCQAFGAELRLCSGQSAKAGTLSDAGCFSFYKTKQLSTFEGGAIIVPDGSRLDVNKIRSISRDGTSIEIGDGSNGAAYGSLVNIGFNFRMSELSALVGLERLKLHEPGIMAELGRYGPKDGYYPLVVYDQPAYKERGIVGNCPVAEVVAARVREGYYQ